MIFKWQWRILRNCLNNFWEQFLIILKNGLDNFKKIFSKKFEKNFYKTVLSNIGWFCEKFWEKIL